MNIKTIKLEIESMSCTHCTATVENSLKELDGVISVKVSLEDNNAIVEYDADIVDSMQMTQATTKAGYPAVVD